MAEHSWRRLIFLVFNLLAFWGCVRLVPVFEHWVSLRWAEGLALLVLLPVLVVAIDLLLGAKLKQTLVQMVKVLASGLFEALSYFETR